MALRILGDGRLLSSDDHLTYRNALTPTFRARSQGLSLSAQVTTYNGRIESLALERGEEFSVVTARALARLSVLMELASPLLKIGGKLICYKAHIQEEEFSHALVLQECIGMSLVSDRSFYLSDGKTSRRLVCFEKSAQPQMNLPRKIGMAQKRPL